METHHYLEMGFPNYHQEHYLQMGFPIYDQGFVIPKEEDFPSFPPLPFDHNFSSWEHDLLPELGYFPPVSCFNMFLTEPLFTTADYSSIQTTPISSENFVFNSGIKHELTESSGLQNLPQLEPNRNRSRTGGVDLTAARREPKPPKIRDGINSRKLSSKAISEHFYMPIMQAAKKLKVGLTQLKKRCREVGIRRWPHRKLMSLQTLIANLQEMGEGDVGRKRSIAILEQEKKLLEAIPDMELGEQTKKLRQSIFKSNYKKRRIMDNSNVISQCVSKSNEACGSSKDVIEIRDNGVVYDRADEEFDTFLSGFFPQTACSLSDL